MIGGWDGWYFRWGWGVGGFLGLVVNKGLLKVDIIILINDVISGLKFIK
jgi:hypothetical protein